MASLIYYLELQKQFGNPVFSNLYFQELGFYKYSYNKNEILYQCDSTKKLFEKFILHPLVFWKLEVVFGSYTILVDYVTNISTHPTECINYLTYRNKYFIHDPSLILDRGFFLQYYNFNEGRLKFLEETKIIKELRYKNDLLEFLNMYNFKHNFFTLQITSNISVPKILKLL